MNGRKVTSPSYLVAINDEISPAAEFLQKRFLWKRLLRSDLKSASAKAPEWLEVDKKNHMGRVLRYPVRTDVQIPVEEYLIVELYSK